MCGSARPFRVQRQRLPRREINAAGSRGLRGPRNGTIIATACITDQREPASPAKQRRDVGMGIRRLGQQGIVFAVFAALFAVFAVVLPGFLTTANMLTLLQNRS